MFSKRPSRRILPLATQFSATPPARQRFRSPVSTASARVILSTISSVTAWIEAAMSMWKSSSSVSDVRAGPAEQRREALVRHGEAAHVVEVTLVEAEAAIVLQVDEAFENDLGEARSAIRRKPHQLVLAGIDLESRVVGERRVEQPQGMGKCSSFTIFNDAPSPSATDVVGHSPTPSKVSTSARSKGEG